MKCMQTSANASSCMALKTSQKESVHKGLLKLIKNQLLQDSVP